MFTILCPSNIRLNKVGIFFINIPPKINKTVSSTRGKGRNGQIPYPKVRLEVVSADVANYLPYGANLTRTVAHIYTDNGVYLKDKK